MDGMQYPKNPAEGVPTVAVSEARRWLIVVMGVFINLGLGSIYAWSIFVEPLILHFQACGQSVGVSEVLLPFSLFLAVFALSMPWAGKYIERYGPRRVAMLGGGLTGVGWLLASFSPNHTVLALVFGGIGGTGVGLAYGVPVTLAARWFPDRRGTALGLTLLGFGVSTLVTGGIAATLIPLYGPIVTLRIFGIAFLLLLPLFASPLSLPPSGWRPPCQVPSPPRPGERTFMECTREEMIRTPAFYGLWVCFFIACAAGLMAISIALPVGMEVAGLESGMATLLVGLFAIFNGGSRPLFGALTDALHPRNAAMISFMLIITGSLLLWHAPNLPVYIISFALLWGALGAWPAIAPASTASYFGTTDYPRCYGVVYLAYGAGAFTGPMLAGFLRTATGSYLGIFPFVAAMAIIGIGIAYWLMNPPSRVR